MSGLNMNEPLRYITASMRYFENGEYHITRVCPDNVLLLVYKGVLRFTEDGVRYEITPGKYHIQKHGSVQKGEVPSDMPEYLYVHFDGQWSDFPNALPRSGEFAINRLFGLMTKMDEYEHTSKTYTEKCGVFFSILSELYDISRAPDTADEILNYFRVNYSRGISLERLSLEFGYSKNQILNIFKNKFGVTPFKYLCSLRLQNAAALLTETSKSVESIAFECGFSDYPHFFKIFKTEYGVAPTEYRRSTRHISVI